MPGSAHTATAILVSFALLFSGCTTTRLYPPPTAEAPAPPLRAGDAVEVLLRNGQSLTLTFIESQPEFLVGVDDEERRQEIPWSDVAVLEVSETSAGKTVAAVGGTLIALYTIGLLVLLLAWDAGY